MLRTFSCGVWIFLSVFLHGPAAFISNSSIHNQILNVRGKGWSSEFHQLRAGLTSYSQPIRPYVLMTNAENYHDIPKPKHRRPSRLRRLLGSSFAPFWMSTVQPPEASGVLTSGGDQDGVEPNYTTSREKFNSSAFSELKEAASNYRQKLEEEAAGLDFGSLPSHVASSIRDWLVRSATCGLRYQWVDLGPAFWPRWLRQTDCERSDGARSCSFPGGMECVRAQTAHVKILAWHCLEVSEDADGIKAGEPDGEVKSGEELKRCRWSLVPYPVVTACTCSCK